MIRKGESASKAVKKNRKDKKLDQLEQVQPSLEQHHEEEVAYQEEQAHLARLRDQAESSGEEEHESDDYFDDNASSAEEEEQPLSKSRRGRTHQADEDARVSQAVEDKLPPSANKTRRQTEDLVDKEVAKLSQAEQFQGQTKTNPSPILSLDLSLPINSTLVGADIQNVSSANAYQSVTYSDDGDITLDSDLGRQMEVTDAGLTSITPVSRLERLTRIKSDSVNSQKISRGLEIIISQEIISITK